jgi:chromosome partitioning protein
MAAWHHAAQMTRVLSFASQKGGVAKTTSAANLAVAWGELGMKSLLVDLDPGFSLTRLCGRVPSQAPATVFDVLNGDEDVRPRDCADGKRTVQTIAAGVDLLAGTRELKQAAIKLAAAPEREFFLAEALEEIAASGEYSAILIDTPPNLELLTQNAIYAASDVLVPYNMRDEGSLQGLVEVRAFLTQMRRTEASLSVVFRVKSDPRRRIERDLEEALSDLRVPVAKAVVPQDADVETAAAMRELVVLSRPRSRAATAYRELAKEIARLTSLEAPMIAAAA